MTNKTTFAWRVQEADVECVAITTAAETPNCGLWGVRETRAGIEFAEALEFEDVDANPLFALARRALRLGVDHRHGAERGA